MISEPIRELAIGGACFPEVHPEAASPDADLAYLKTKVEAGASFLITQLFFDNRVYFEFVERRAPPGSRCRSSPGVIPIVSYAQVEAHLRALRREHPGAAGGLAGGPGRRRARRVRVRHQLRSAQMRRAAGRRRAGHPLLRAQPLARHAGDPGGAAGRAPVGAAPPARRPRRPSPARPRLRPVPQFEHQGHRIAYDVYGEGDRPLVLIHGLLVNRHMFDRLAPAMADRGNRVITVDLLGHGESDQPPEMVNYANALLRAAGDRSARPPRDRRGRDRWNLARRQHRP